MKARAALAAAVLVAWAAPAPASGPGDAPVPSVDAAPPPGPTPSERLAEIQRRVQRTAAYPPIARARAIGGESVVEFEIGADGRPGAIRTARSSGSALLDRAAREAVLRAAPLPWLYGRIRVPVRFALREE